ncbi:hypothetical protein [Actinomadura pelletieri]|uniref:hypothetical protein n=1 Tax=Actinomadura pelletieri TaxID=111805 RepID=UPI001FE824CE|nr:hypothetical protein [Actinomadura pelletieri]
MTLVDTWRELGRFAAASARLTTILNAEPDLIYTADRAPTAPITPEITFDAVAFRYRSGLPDALHDITFTVPQDAPSPWPDTPAQARAPAPP